MAHALHPVWDNLDLDVQNNKQNEKVLDTLADLCIKKLISDVYLIKCITALPSTLHKRLMNASLSNRRNLSAMYLMKSYPFETLKLPIPDNLKSLNAVTKGMLYNDVTESSLMKFTSTAIMMISTFFDIISDNSGNSKLCCLEVCDIPICSNVFIRQLINHLPKSGIESTASHLKYTLKLAIEFENSKDVDTMCRFKNFAKHLGLKCSFTGIIIANGSYQSSSLVDLCDVELQKFGTYLAAIFPSIEPVLFSFSNYTFVKHLTLSYLSDRFFKETFYGTLSTVLSQLTCLENLILCGTKLTGQLSVILGGFHEHKQVSGKRCCLIHNGILRLLNIGFCGVNDTDIAVLQLLALQNCLRYLDISSNHLDSSRTFDTLFSLKSSLCVLMMGNCFRPQIPYNPREFPVKHFEKLRHLNVEGNFTTPNCYKMLEDELSKLPNEVFFKN